jgi:hypothetical protein
MSIVRSLLIKIGFQNDRSSFNAAEKSVSRFKTKAVAAAGAISYAFVKVASYFTNFASNILDTNEFSKHIGIAIDDLYALQRAAQKVARIEEKDFQTALGNIQKMFNDLRMGAGGELQHIADYTGIQVDRINDTAQTIFFKFLGYLQGINSEAERSRIAENLFKGVDFKKFANLAGNMERFTDSAKDFAENGQKISGQITQLEGYIEAVNELGIAWQNFVVGISSHVIPVIQDLISPLSQVFGYVKDISNIVKFSKDFWGTIFTGDIEGFKENAKFGSKILDAPFAAVGSAASGAGKFISDLISENLGPFWQRFVDYAEGRDRHPDFMRPGMAGGAPNVTVNNEINVPAGTTEEQAQYTADRIQRTIDESIDNTWRMIQYNYPTVE